MSNKFGKIFSFTTFGESHGKALGCIIDGVPAQIELSEADIQPFLDKRRPGQSKFTTQRDEKDRVEILSGVFEGKTTGTPIACIIYNEDQKSKDYGDIKDKFRPNHADFAYFLKYGIRDYRGGGRSSARETAARVVAGAVARKVLAKKGIEIFGYLSQMGKIKIDENNLDFSQINQNDFFCPDAKAAVKFADYLTKIRKEGDSIGAKITLVAKNVPAGLGEPIYNKLDATLAGGLMSINAVKYVEIGNGLAGVEAKGSEFADEMWKNDAGEIEFSANNSGGILGGISSGQDVVASFGVKPTSSILKERKTIDVNGNNTTIVTKGRHDPCVGIRAVPVGEAMMACVLLDFLLIYGGQKWLNS